jgi:hypothetical protein
MSNTEHDVTVRLSTVGDSAMASTLNNIKGVLSSMQQTLNDGSAAGQRLSTTFRQTTADGDKFSVTMRQMADSTGGAAGGMDALSGSILKSSAIIGGVVLAFEALKDALESIVKTGVDFNSFFEMNKLALGAWQLSFGQYVDATGKAVSQTDQWSNAIEQSTETQQLLVKQSLISAASIKDLTNVFQMMYGAMIAGGAKSQQEMVTFAGVTADMAAVMGTSYDRAARQMTLALLGVTRTTGQLGAMLRSMGIDNATLKSWRDQGTIVEELTTKLHAFVDMQQLLQNTWVGITTNMTTAWQLLSAAVAAPIFDQLKNQMQDFLHSVIDFGTGKLQPAAQDIATALGQVFKSGLDVITSLFLGAFDTINGGMGNVGTTWKDVLNQIAAGTEVALAAMKTMWTAYVVGTQATASSLVTVLKMGYGPDSGQMPMDKIKSAFVELKGLWADVDKTVNQTMTDAGDKAKARLDEIFGGKIMTAPRIPGLQGGAPLVGGDLAGYQKNPNEQDTSKQDAILEEMATKTKEMQEKANAYTAQGLDQKLALLDAEAVKENDTYEKMANKAIAAGASVAVAQKAYDAEWMASEAVIAGKKNDLYLAEIKMAKAKDDALAKSTAENDAWQVGEEEKLQDQMDAITLNYYDKQQANINKQIDSEQKILDVKKAAGKLTDEQYANDTNTLTALSDKRTALNDLEANSIIGLRKTWAEQANLIVMTSDSMDAGITAGWLAIMGTMKTTTESMRDFMAGVWNDMTTAFDTGFYDILSGKFSDLGNVLKNLWDSILKDFSKMLEQMLVKWILTGDAMGNSQGSGGGLSGIIKGIFGGGSTPVYTPGGTSANSPGSTVGENNTGGIPGLQGGAPLTNGQQGSSAAGYAGLAGGVAGAGYGLYSAYQAVTASDITSRPTYQGQDLGQTANFGHPSETGALVGAAAAVAAGVAVAASAAVTLELLTAAAAATATVVGIVVAVVLVIAAALLAIFSGPQEGHVKIAMQDALSKSGGATAIGNFVQQIIGATTDFVGGLALKAGDNVSQYTQAYQKAFKTAYGNATFDLHAGSPDDLQKDVNAFFQTVLPTLAMKAAFGQTGYGFGGNSDVTGGIAGTSWNANNPAIMDAQGNWVKQQLYDPNAPIPLMLTGLGFTAGKIGDIASMLAGGEDIATFQKYLSDLVGVVAGFDDLVTQMSRSTSDWYTYLTQQKNIQGTAAQFATDITNIQGQGALLEGQSATDQVTTAQSLLTSGQAILTEEQSAFSAILGFIDQINTAATAMIQSYQQKLLDLTEGSSQKFHEMSVSTTADYQTMLEAANPADVTADWTKVQTDFQGMLDGLLAEIQQVMQLQASYAAFRTQMATDAGPQFATDPTAWLNQNMAQINAITTTLKTATGSDAITDAQTLLTLVQQRYSNELAALQKVNDAIKSIDQASQTSIQNLTMQAMGSVTTDASGNKTWTPDTHAQGDYLDQQYNSLMGQLGTATTTDEVTSLMSQINSVISQLAAQPQDPAHYAESRQILIKMQQDSQDAADKLLKTMHDSLTADIKGIGDLLKAGEASLDNTLTADTWAYDQALKNFATATTAATTELNAFADALVTQMGLLIADVQHWLFILTNPVGTVDPNWNYGSGTTPTTSTQKTVVQAPGAGGVQKPALQPVPATVSPVSVSVTVNSGTPEEIGQAAAAAVYPMVVATVKQNNVELARAFRNNPSLVRAS